MALILSELGGELTSGQVGTLIADLPIPVPEPN